MSGSKSTADCQRRVVPGKIWIAVFAPIVFWGAAVAFLVIAPDRLRESLLTTEQDLVTLSPDELVGDESRDSRYVILKDVRVESIAEREERSGGFPQWHQLRPLQGGDDAHRLQLFVVCDNAVLPGAQAEPMDADFAVRDKRDVKQWTGMLRRPNAFFFRIDVVSEELGISPATWLLFPDAKPYRPAIILAMVCVCVCAGSFAWMLMMSQNWIPNTTFYAYIMFKCVSLWGWPLRRYRDRWTVRLALLAIASVMLASGTWCICSRDLGYFIDSYYLELWFAAFALWTFGLATAARVVWIVVTPVPSPAAAIVIRDEAGDEREASDPWLPKVLASLRSITGGVAVVALLALMGNGLAGRPMGLLDSPIVLWAFVGMSALSGASHWLLQLATRGFQEKNYEPLDKTPRRIASLRNKCEPALQSAGFTRNGVYRVRGSSFHTFSEFHLGCQGMVIAEFILLSGTKAIELVSITESGICVLTASSQTPEGKPARRDSEYLYSHTSGIKNLGKLLRCHLQSVAKVAERNETTVAVLSQEDVVDVTRYSGRAFHHLLFEQGETRDPVGPARYGRFRFPTGLSTEETQTDVTMETAAVEEMTEAEQPAYLDV